MSVPPLDLDTMTWAELVAVARDRLVPLSRGRWTLHGPVDPGITLLELFAWQLEQRLFVLQDEPDAVVRAVIDLLGVDPPRPARPAATVLRLSRPDEPEDPRGGLGPITVPAGSTLGPLSVDEALGLTTEQAVTAVPGLRATAGPPGRPPPDGDGTALAMALRHRSAAAPTGFSLFVEVAPAAAPDEAGDGTDDRWPTAIGWPVPAGDEPGSSPATGGRGDDPLDDLGGPRDVVLVDREGIDRPPLPPPADLGWRVTVGGLSRDLDAAEGQIGDGTVGLRHSGIVTVALPADLASTWTAGTDLELRALAAAWTFTYPPLVSRCVPNAVAARQQVDHEVADPAELLRASLWPPRPGMTLALPGGRGRLVDDPAGVRVRFTEVRQQPPADGGPGPFTEQAEDRDWAAVPDLAFAEPADRVFEIDRAAGVLRFGDGRRGRVPRLPGPGRLLTARIAYRLGGGGFEGVEPGAAWAVRRPPASPDEPPAAATEAEAAGAVTLLAHNVVALGGGAGSESIGDARDRVAQAVGGVRRLVTDRDHVELARATPGADLVRAQVVADLDPRTCTHAPDTRTVVCVPRAPRGDRLAGRARVPDPALDAGLAAALARRFARARLVGSFVHVRGPRYRRVRLEVVVAPGVHHLATVRDRLRAELVAHVDAVEGGAGRQGWPVGQALRPTDLLARARRAAGATVDVRRVGVALDGAAPEWCDPVALGPLDLPALRPSDVSVTVRGEDRP